MSNQTQIEPDYMPRIKIYGSRVFKKQITCSGVIIKKRSCDLLEGVNIEVIHSTYGYIVYVWIHSFLVDASHFEIDGNHVVWLENMKKKIVIKPKNEKYVLRIEDVGEDEEKRFLKMWREYENEFRSLIFGLD